MFTGKCKAAIDLLSNTRKGGVHHILNHVDPEDPSSPSVRDVLISKHPSAQPAHQDYILGEEPEIPHPTIFDAIDAGVIRSAA